MIDNRSLDGEIMAGEPRVVTLRASLPTAESAARAEELLRAVFAKDVTPGAPPSKISVVIL